MTRTGFLEKSHYAIYYIDHPANHAFAVGFFVCQKMKPGVIAFENIRERLRTLREEIAESEEDTFYEAVERTLDACLIISYLKKLIAK